MVRKLTLPEYDTYDEMIADPKWQKALANLDAYLVDALVAAGAPPELNGNLFYAHKDPEFQGSQMVPQFDIKRRNLFTLAKRSTHMFEVGVNGGHSLFLALSANPELRVTGVDICRTIADTWARVDIYVPKAFEWLEKSFPKRCTFITGNSLVELPRYVEDNPDETIDLLHLDGAKDTHLREFLAAYPLMTRGALVLQDDTNTRPVRKSMLQILSLEMAKKFNMPKNDMQRTPGHKVLRVL